MTRPWILAIATLTLTACGLSPVESRLATRGTAPLHARAANPDRFFAHADVEAQAPDAFALQTRARSFLTIADRVIRPQRDALVAALAADPTLGSSLRRFDQLTWNEQWPLLQRVAAVESQVMGFTLPPVELSTSIAGPSFFDFDPAKPGTGRVLLNPAAIAQAPNKWTALLLTVHEVRHSGQFQLAYSQPSDPAIAVLAHGYRAAFEAQHRMMKTLSFCDFCDLFNEYEAFQTGNYVVGRLTNWQADTTDMGPLDVLYDHTGRLQVDLRSLLDAATGSDVIERFNQLEQVQFQPPAQKSLDEPTSAEGPVTALTVQGIRVGDRFFLLGNDVKVYESDGQPTTVASIRVGDRVHVDSTYIGTAFTYLADTIRKL